MFLAYAWAAVLLLLCSALASDSLEAGHMASVPHEDVFGVEIEEAVCQGRNRQADIDKILQGDRLPYGFAGPATGCDTWGCRVDYWMSRCRWDAKNEPACPLEARKSLVARLSQQLQKGSNWIEAAFAVKPCELWPLIKGRTIWMVGDSLSQDVATSLVCFMVEYMGPDGRAITDDADILQSLTKSASGKEMRTWCFPLEADTRICSLRANKVPRLVNIILEALTSIADRNRDIAILNVGAWYNYMEDGMAELQRDMVKFEIVFNRLRDKLPKQTIWRESTAQHFNTTSGMFDHRVSIGEQRCAAAGSQLGLQLGLDADRKLVHSPHSLNDTKELDVMLSGGHRNSATQPVIDRLGIDTWRIWNVSLIFHQFHNNYHRPDSGGHCVWVECDCSHACSPSWYPLILADFIALLQSAQGHQYPASFTSTGYNRTLINGMT